MILLSLCERNPCVFVGISVFFTPEAEEEFTEVGVDGREDVPLPNTLRARTALDPKGACLVDNFRRSYGKYRIFQNGVISDFIPIYDLKYKNLQNKYFRNNCGRILSEVFFACFYVFYQPDIYAILVLKHPV